MQHNIRDSKGRFASAQSIPVQPVRVVSGRLYGYKGSVVRALHVSSSNNTAVVSLHKALTGSVPVTELTKVDKAAVDAYLAHA